jgi:hypothetical protein
VCGRLLLSKCLSRERVESGAPRKVFRRGCNKASLTQVLGGIGTDPAPITLKVPMEDQNPFILK